MKAIIVAIVAMMMIIKPVRVYVGGGMLDLIETSVLNSKFPPRRSEWALDGNYAPIREEREFRIKGTFPDDMERGAFLRIGPNPQYDPKGGYHWFDGDGMIHAVFFGNGNDTISYENRYVRTPRWIHENSIGKETYLKLGSMQGIGGLIKILVLSPLRKLLGVIPSRENKDGTANTNLLYWNHRLLALVENALPFRVRVENQDISSIGYEDMNSLLNFPVIAHPKVDRRTGELMALGYILNDAEVDARYAVFRPTSSETGRDIEKITEFPLKFNQKVMIHDMAITDKYTIVPEFSLAFKPKEMVKTDQVFQLDYNSSARFHVFPRYAKSQKDQNMIFDLGEPGMGFHMMNAYDHSNRVVRVVGCFMNKFSMGFGEKKGETENATLIEWSLDLISGSATKRVLYDRHNIEFVRVREDRVGVKNRYGFGGLQHMADGGPKFYGFVKIDMLGDDEPKEIFFPPNRVGGEMIFVPRRGGDSDVNGDDGYMMGFLYDELYAQSELVIYDAKTMLQEPISKLLIPQRVPFGFHATWLSDVEISSLL